MIRYGTVGDPKNPAIVLIHGFLGAALDWEPLLPQLSQSLFCVVVTLPGHSTVPIQSGKSSLFPDLCVAIQRLLDRLEINSAAFAGYSLGGRVSIEFAKHAAHRVRHLFAIGSHFGLDSELERQNRLHSDQKIAKTLNSQHFPEFLGDWYSQALFAGVPENPQYADFIADKIRLHRPTNLAIALERFSLGHQRPFEWNDSSFSIDYIVGQNDKKYLSYSGTLPKNERLTISTLENGSHALLFQRPDSVSELILSRIPF